MDRGCRMMMMMMMIDDRDKDDGDDDDDDDDDDDADGKCSVEVGMSTIVLLGWIYSFIVHSTACMIESPSDCCIMISTTR